MSNLYKNIVVGGNCEQNFTSEHEVLESCKKSYLYDKHTSFSNEDHSEWLNILKKQGVTVDSLFQEFDSYIDSNLQSYDIPEGFSDVSGFYGAPEIIEDQSTFWKKTFETPAYIYVHTIDQFLGEKLQYPTVIYIGISTDEQPRKSALSQRFGRGTIIRDRNYMWQEVVEQAGEPNQSIQFWGSRRQVHIHPHRLIVGNILAIEEFFIAKLGRLIISDDCPINERGPLTNIKCYNGAWDPALQSERIKDHYKKYPQLKGKGGIISNQQKKFYQENPHRAEEARERIIRYFATLPPEQKEEHYTTLTDYFETIEEWSVDFLKDYRYDINYWGPLLDDSQDIKISDEYTAVLEKIRQSSFFIRVPRRTKAINAATKFSKDLIYPEYNTYKVKKYLAENPDYANSAAFEKTGGYLIPSWFKMKEEYREIFGTSVPEDERHQKLNQDFKGWCIDFLDPYKHSYTFPTDVNAEGYIKKMQKAQESEVYSRVNRMDSSVSESDWDWDLVYLETRRKRGPGWKPNIRLLKKKYKDQQEEE